MKWRLVPLEANDAFTNMAIDEAVCEAVKNGESLPTIRFYRWQPSAVSIGCFQSLEDEVSQDVCKGKGIDVVRRRTGGGAVYHDYDGEITYSVIMREEMMPKGITESYHEICGWIVNAMKSLDIDASFKPINDIVVGEKKISGNAQTRRNNILLQHGTILYTVDLRTMFTVLKVGADKISDKLIEAAEERVTSISKLKPDLSYEDVLKSLTDAFIADKDIVTEPLSETEKNRAQELVKTRYNTEEWNAKK